MNNSLHHPWRAKFISLFLAVFFWWFLKSQLEPNFLQKEWQLHTLRQLNETTSPSPTLR